MIFYIYNIGNSQQLKYLLNIPNLENCKLMYYVLNEVDVL